MWKTGASIIIIARAVEIVLASKYPAHFNRNATRRDVKKTVGDAHSTNAIRALANQIPADGPEKYIYPSFLAQLRDYLQRTAERRTYELQLCEARANQVYKQITNDRKEETKRKLRDVVIRLWELKALKRKLLGDPMNGDEYRLLDSDTVVEGMKKKGITLNDIKEFINAKKAELRILESEEQGTDKLEGFREKEEMEEAERKVGKEELARRHVKLLLEQLYGEKPSLRTIKLFANRPRSIPPQTLSTLQSKTKNMCNKIITKFVDNSTGLYEFKVYDKKPVICGRVEVRPNVILGDCILDKYGVYKLRLILGQLVRGARYYYIAIYDYECKNYKVIDYFIEIKGKIIFEPRPTE